MPDPTSNFSVWACWGCAGLFTGQPYHTKKIRMLAGPDKEAKYCRRCHRECQEANDKHERETHDPR